MHQTHHGLHHHGIELRAGIVAQVAQDLFLAQAGPIRAIRFQSVVHIGHGKNARVQRNLLPGEAFRIALSVLAFVMVQHDRDQIGKPANGLQDFRAQRDVFVHRPDFFRRELARLIEQRAGDADFADVVEQPAAE